MAAMSVWIQKCQGMHGLRMLEGGEDVVKDKADHNFLEMLVEGEIPIEEAIKVPISQPWLQDPGKATDLSGQEEVQGWRLTYQSSRTKRQKMLWPTAHDSGTINTCCHMSQGHYKGYQETLLGV